MRLKAEFARRLKGAVMIQETRFWGIPIRTRRQRRMLVVLYYLLLLAMGGIGLWLGPRSWVDLITFTFIMGGLLGGISYEAPVKAYERLPVPLNADGPQTLNLSGRRENRVWIPLDERELMERNQAHYTAFRILRWSVGFGAVVYVFSLTWTHPGALLDVGKQLPVLVWLLVVYVLSLPQAVVLWTAPQEPVGELAELRKR
jgi:polyferredoxin